MTTDICKDSSVATGSTKQLKDSRDQKYYWIAKLADQNCWMTQNLDFDIPSTLSNTTSDVSSASVSSGTTKVTAPNGWSGNTATYNAYYDPGDYIYNGPSNGHAQGTRCDVTGTNTLSSCNQFTTTVANTNASGNTNNHYHVGNYYSFSAATVKSGDSLTNRGDQATDSICPKGWGLPTTGSLSNVLFTDGETFAKLFAAYGWAWEQFTWTDTLNGGTSYYIYNAPFYFTYGGNLGSSTLYAAGYGGFYWSSTVTSGTNAFTLYFDSNVYPANSYNRYLGFSVRCVAE